MKAGKYEAAKHYIIYRQQHSEKRAQQQAEIKDKFEHHKLMINKTNGHQEFFDIKKIKTTYNLVAK